MPAIPAAQPQEAVGQDAALQEGVELVFDELRQVGPGALFGLGYERRGMLLHQAVQRGLLRAVARVVHRGAIAMRPPGLVSVGLHALGMGNLDVVFSAIYGPSRALPSNGILELAAMIAAGTDNDALTQFKDERLIAGQRDGDMVGGILPCGQIAGALQDLIDVAEFVPGMVEQACDIPVVLVGPF